MLFGGCPAGSHVAFSTQRLHYDQITLLSPFHFGTAAVKMAKEWLTGPGFDLTKLITSQRDLADAEMVFSDLQAGLGIKYVFHP